MLPSSLITDLVRTALSEDLGRRGDITSQALIPSTRAWTATLVARQNGVIAGLPFARETFRQTDAQTEWLPLREDGENVQKGDALVTITGRALPMLAAERTALNILSHLSGVATLTRRYVEAAAPHKAQICCTRKTLPGLRVAEKYAVRMGGGANHRFGLDDAMLIKDNHIAVSGDIRAAAQQALAAAGHMIKVEVEVDTLAQLESLLDLPIDAVLLDNMPPDTLRRAVEMVAGRFVTEASGGVTLDTVAAIAATGVDMISVGALTHSAPALDIALDG